MIHGELVNGCLLKYEEAFGEELQSEERGKAIDLGMEGGELMEQGKVLVDVDNYSRGAEGELIVPKMNQMEDDKFFGSEKGFNMLEEVIGRYKTKLKRAKTVIVGHMFRDLKNYLITIVNIVDPISTAKYLESMGRGGKENQIP